MGSVPVTPADHAAWDVRDLVDRAASVLEQAEAAQHFLDRGDVVAAIEALEFCNEAANWVALKHKWALERLQKDCRG